MTTHHRRAVLVVASLVAGLLWYFESGGQLRGFLLSLTDDAVLGAAILVRVLGKAVRS